MNPTVQRLRALRNAVAAEIDPASRGASVALESAVVKARDALNDALVAAGDPEAIETAKRHCSLDEMRTIVDGDVGLPDGMSP